MTRLIEQTWNFNITPRIGVQGELLVQVEELAPMSAEEFVTWLHKASASVELPLRPAKRDSVRVWRDTKESPQPREALEKLSEFNKQWKKFKRRFPQLSNEELNKKTQEWLDMKQSFLQSFAEMGTDELLKLG